jgi:hypothetical protein
MKRKSHVRFGGRPSEKCPYSRATRRRPTLRERLGWMEERMCENAALLESYLALAGEEETLLPGGYILLREEGSGTPVRVRRVAAGGGFEQLRINER